MFGLYYNSNTNYSVNYSTINFCLRALVQGFTAGVEYLFTADCAGALLIPDLVSDHEFKLLHKHLDFSLNLTAAGKVCAGKAEAEKHQGV